MSPAQPSISREFLRDQQHVLFRVRSGFFGEALEESCIDNVAVKRRKARGKRLEVSTASSSQAQEQRELLEEMGFDEASTPIVKGSALCALEDTKPELGVDAINELMNVVDESIPTPERDLDVPFLMPIDHVHNIQGRGCVITGRMERGKLKTGQEVEVIGYGKSAKGKVTGIEMFHKILEEANAGDQMGLLARGIKSQDVSRGMCVVKPKSVKACDQFVAQVDYDHYM